MPSETQIAQLLSLLNDTREQLTYFKELGVTGTELTSPNQNIHGYHSAETNTPPGVVFEDRLLSDVTRQEEHPPQHDSSSPPSDTLFGDLSLPPVRIQKSAETFEAIWADVGDCTRCPLHQARTNIVHTDGNRNARLMFVGEAPGADEDAQARPFVGRAGQLLTKIIEAIGFRREEVLIGNVNRCRPPANRPPTPEEAAMCKPFLLREIAAVQPDVIVVLGNTAMKNLLDIKQGITRVRGQFQDYHGVKVMPTFHPAYLLRDPSKKKETWEDLKKVRDYLDATRKQEN
jgi:uracil-DNA glycosylase family 4